MTDKSEGSSIVSMLVDDMGDKWTEGNPVGVSKSVARARESGYVDLTPIQRQFALEFVLSGTTLRKIARLMDVPYAMIVRMYNHPIVRAYISDLQKEVAAHKLINDQWVENQIMKVMPMLLGEQMVDIVTSKGAHIRKKKFHAAEITSLLKHYGGAQEQKGTGGNGVNIQINLGDMLSPAQAERLGMQGRIIDVGEIK